MVKVQMEVKDLTRVREVLVEVMVDLMHLSLKVEKVDYMVVAQDV